MLSWDFGIDRLCLYNPSTQFASSASSCKIVGRSLNDTRILVNIVSVSCQILMASNSRSTVLLVSKKGI